MVAEWAKAVGGPIDGKIVKAKAPRMKVASEPIKRTYWDGESMISVFTEHTYRWDRETNRLIWEGEDDEAAG